MGDTCNMFQQMDPTRCVVPHRNKKGTMLWKWFYFKDIMLY